MFAHRGYLLDVTHRVPKARTLELLVDVLALYRYNEFFVFAERELPASLDSAKLVSYCEMQGLKAIALDRFGYEELFVKAEYAFASTCAERSLAGRVEEMREEMERAERNGRLRKTTGFLVTDFGDECAWQPLAVSLPGIIMGGAFATDGAKSTMMDLEKELDRRLDAPLGGLLLRLGTLYLRGGANRERASEYFNILAGDHGYSRHPGITEHVLEDVSGIAHGVRIQAERWLDRSEWAAEIVYAANLLDCACHRRSESRLHNLRDEHGRIWRMRFEDEGRVASLTRLPRF